jgi:hypothetical protein
MAETDTNVGDTRLKTPVHLWIVGVLSLLWNLMGAFNYIMSQFKVEAFMSQMTPEQLAYFEAYPAWMVAAWAFGVWGALAGSILLLLRRKWAVWAFAVSLAGLFVGTIYNFVLSNGAEIMGAGNVAFTVVIWVVAIFLLYYAWSQAKRNVLV